MAGNRAAYDAAMRQAEQHSQSLDWKGAVAAYKLALTEYPQDVAATVGIGQALSNVGQVDTALQAFQRAVQLDERNVSALAALAAMQERLGRLTGAATNFRQIGDIEYHDGRLADAVDAWTKATRLAPEQVETYEKLGRTLERLGQTAKAVEEYVTLSEIYEKRRNLGAAIDACQHALRLDARNAELQTRLSRLRRIALGPTSELTPLDQVERAIEETPGERADEPFLDADARFLDAEEQGADPYDLARRRALHDMADLLFETGVDPSSHTEVAKSIVRAIDEQMQEDYPKAIASVCNALEKRADHPALKFNLGALYRDNGDLDKAANTFSSLLTDGAFVMGAQYGLGLVYADAGDFIRSAKHFLAFVKDLDQRTMADDRHDELTVAYEALEIEIDSVHARGADLFVNTVRRFFSRPDWAQSVARARHNLDKVTPEGRMGTLAAYLGQPETSVVVDTLAVTDGFIQARLLRTALEECLYAIEQAPYDLSLHLRLGEVLLLQQQLPQAAAKFLAVADYYATERDDDRAIELYFRALTLTPMDIVARRRLIQMLIKQGRVADAVDQYVVLADVHYQLAKLDLALKAYDDALALTKLSPEMKNLETDILLKKADIYEQRVDWQGSTTTMEAVVAADPTNERALTALVDLYTKQRQPRKASQTLDALVAVYQQSDRVRDMLSVVETLVERFPTDVGLRARLTAMYARHGYTDDACAQAEVLARLHLQAGRREDAIRTVEILRKLAPSDNLRFRRLMDEIEAQPGRGTTTQLGNT